MLILIIKSVIATALGLFGLSIFVYGIYILFESKQSYIDRENRLISIKKNLRETSSILYKMTPKIKHYEKLHEFLYSLILSLFSFTTVYLLYIKSNISIFAMGVIFFIIVITVLSFMQGEINLLPDDND